MPRSVGIVVENNFTGGLVTEATALNFPENAVTDIDNCVISKVGSVSRRGALNYEPGKVFQNDPYTGNIVTTTFQWRITGGNGDLVILVVQIGQLLYFYRTNTGATSPAKYGQTIDLTPYQTSPNAPALNECQYAVGNGYLFVTNPNMNPVYIEFFPATVVFSVKLIPLAIRDFVTLEDGLGVSERPATLSDTHRYLLFNAGWDQPKIDKFKTDVGLYPSKADVFWILKDSYGNFAPGRITYQKSVNDKIIDVPGDLRADTVFRGNTPAPIGHYTVNPFYLDRTTITGIPNIPITNTVLRPANVAFYSGRVFYSGVKAPGYTDKIYFSQTIENTGQFGKCYQVNDPTSENLFNLLATDGGVISIPEAGDIIKLFTMAAALVVFATNGIWVITGSTGIGFAATDYTVSKVSSINVKTATSFVDFEGNPVFWNEEGIFVGAPGQMGQVQVTSMTEKSIKQFYQLIPLSSRAAAKGTYNPLEKTIEWLYRSTAPNNLEETYSYDRALIYSTQYQGFYKWSFDLPIGTRIASIITQYGSVLNPGSYDPVTYKNKYLTYVSGAGVTLSEIIDNTYKDFGLKSFSSYFTTGYKLRGQAVKQGQTNYLYVYFTKQYGSRLSVQALWDYSTSGNTGRWSSKQVVESGRGDYSYDFRKLKIRGQGKAVQYKFSSIGDDPFNIPGWGAVDSTNAGP